MPNPSLLVTEADFTRVMALRPDPPLRAELERAIVVDPNAMPSDVVALGSHVRYRDEHSGTSRCVQVVGPDDADAAAGRISVLAPVGAALLGLSVGQAIEWKFPGGEVRTLRVEHVSGGPT